MHGQTPLSLAAGFAYDGAVKWLLEFNADVETKQKYGQTPLWLAAREGYEGIVRLLLGAKADVSRRMYRLDPVVIRDRWRA
jgi:ankyrin repeat protein